MSGVPIDYDYIRTEGKAGRIGQKLMAVVAESKRGRIFCRLSAQTEAPPKQSWKPDHPLPNNPRDFKTPNYGLLTFADLFTPRQLLMLNTFSDLVAEARDKVRRDAIEAKMPNDPKPLSEGGIGSTAYAEAIATYLAATVSKITSYHCSLGVWRANMSKSGRAFGRQAIPMVWDFPECNPFAGAGGDWEGACGDAAKVIESFFPNQQGQARQAPCPSME